MLSFFTTPYTTERLTQTGYKSDYVAKTSGNGCLMQKDDRVSSLNSAQFAEAYQLFVESSKDIVVTDRITINGEQFEVGGIKSRGQGSFAFKILALNKKKL